MKVEINKGSSKRMRDRKLWTILTDHGNWGEKETEFMIEAH